MTEANFSFTTKVNEDLFTIRGATYEEFTNNVGVAGANLEQLITDLTLIQAGAAAAELVNSGSAPAAPAFPSSQQQGGWPSQPPAAPPANAFQQASAPANACPHGPLVYKEFTSKAGKFTKIWTCSQGDRACSQYAVFVN